MHSIFNNQNINIIENPTCNLSDLPFLFLSTDRHIWDVFVLSFPTPSHLSHTFSLSAPLLLQGILMTTAQSHYHHLDLTKNGDGRLLLSTGLDLDSSRRHILRVCKRFQRGLTGEGGHMLKVVALSCGLGFGRSKRGKGESELSSRCSSVLALWLQWPSAHIPVSMPSLPHEWEAFVAVGPS